MIAGIMEWDMKPRAEAVVPPESKITILENTTFSIDGHYWAIPKGVPQNEIDVILDLMKFMLQPEQQALTWKAFIGPVNKKATLDTAPPDIRDYVKEFWRPGIRRHGQEIQDRADARGAQAAIRVRPLGQGSRRAEDQAPVSQHARLAALPDHQAFRGEDRPRRLRPRGAGPPVRDAARPERLRQIHRAQHRGGPHPGERRRAVDRRRAHGSAAGREARLRHGVPELRAVPAHDRVRQRRLRPRAPAPARRPKSASASARCCSWCSCRATRIAIPRSSRAASSSASRSRARWCMQPRLLLLDEPLSNLDAKLRIEMRAEIKRIHASLGLTCIYVTHDQTEALSLSDWIVVMRDGIVMQAGPPHEIYNRPEQRVRRRLHGLPEFLLRRRSAAAGGRAGRGRERPAAHPRPCARRVRAPAQTATAAIRPEDVQVGGDAAGAEPVPRQGRDRRVSRPRQRGGAARSRRQSSLWVRTPARLAPGETVPVTFPPDKVIFLPGDAGAAAVMRRFAVAESRASSISRPCCASRRRCSTSCVMFVYPFLHGIYLSLRPAKAARV